MQLSRRQLLRGTAGTAAALGSTWLLSQVAGEPVAFAAPDTPGARPIKLDEGTNYSAALSPDGSTVIVDLLTMLWTVPITGGKATRLTEIAQEATAPDFAPDGRRVVCQSFESGNFHLALLDLDSGDLKALTSGDSDHREPRFSPDGTKIAFSGEVAGRYAIRTLTLSTGEITTWTEGGPGQDAHPVWLPDGSGIAFTTGEADSHQTIDMVDWTGRRKTLAKVTEGELVGPSLSPDGTLAFVHLKGGATSLVIGGQTVSNPADDVFPFAPYWVSPRELLYTANGKITRLNLDSRETRNVPFSAQVSVVPAPKYESVRDFDSTASRPVKGILSPSLSPDGRKVTFQALGNIWVMPLGGSPEAVIADGTYNTDPTWSPDGKSLAYTSDRAGDRDIWLHDIDSGQDRRLTALRGDERAPAFSPDGSLIAFLSGGSLSTVTVATGEVRTVVRSLGSPGNPTFTASGQQIALAGLLPSTERYREGTNQILIVDIESGEARYVAPTQGKFLVNRVDAGPVYAPNGRSVAFVVGGTVWISDVDGNGVPTGKARQISDETGDCPSWSGDSQSLLYISNGRLRLIGIQKQGITPLPTKLTWTTQKHSGTKIIRAGAVWDGTSRTLRKNIDIVIENNRIAQIGGNVPKQGAEVIDARGLTVIPGMVATHEHVPWTSNRIPRLWLSFGITSLRSPGSGNYTLVEAKEAQESGNRIGPRVFGAGELIEGSRVYQGVNRHVTNEDELRRELERIEELGHDLVKSYVRLPYSMQVNAIQGAHQHGVPTTSHHLFGPATGGAAGVEHLGGTNRYGYQQKQSHLGHHYADVLETLIRSGITLTPTFGLPGVAERASLYHFAEWAKDDPRLSALLPSDRYKRFREEVEAAVETKPERALAFTAGQVETVKKVLDRGGHVAIGTDSPIVPQAIFYHLSLAAMSRNGITPFQVAQCATIEGARALGMDKQIGTIDKGKLADLAFVRGNPLEDVKALAQVEQVMVNGTLHTVTDLIGSEPAPTAVPVHTYGGEIPQASFFWHKESYSARHNCC